MQKIYLTSLLFVITGLILETTAQKLPERVVVSVPFSAEGNVRVSAVREIPLDDISSFLAYSITWEGSGEEIAIRFSTDGQEWGDWKVLHHDPNSFEPTPKKGSELGFTSRDARYFQLQVTQGTFAQLKGHFYNPGDSPEARTQPSFTPNSRLECSCAQPEYQRRNDWCPDGACPPNPNPLMNEVTHLIVHHSAGTNTSSDWAAVVRSIWDFYVNTSGYSDIPFNWLIDPNGVAYEGRGDTTVGAAFCGTNFGAMSICVMGNFDFTEPSEEARNALVEWLAWNSCDKDIDPLGSSFHASSGLTLANISGHRDGCNTTSPGELLYAQLPAIRNQVSEYIDTECIVSVANEFFNPSTVELFPNPAGSAIAVHMENSLLGEMRFQWFDLQGNLLGDVLTMEKSAAEQTFYLHTGTLRPGMYLLQITHRQGLASFKMVKQ